MATLEGVDQLNGINRHNQMVGSGVTDCGTVSALMYHEGEVHSLLAGLDHAYSRAVDINDRGIVVGEVTLGESPETRSFPFIWNNGVFEVLTELAGHAVLAINNRDQVLLRPPPVQVDAGLQPVGALWEAGVLTPLGSVPGARGLYVNDLNNVGQVVGNLYKVGGSNVGFLWENGTIREIPELSSATAINDGGLIAGSARTTTQQSPAIWDGENLRLFGGQNDSEPVWLGNDGSVLGPHYVYVDGVLSQLSINVRNSWTTIEAREMNDDGVIVGDIDAIVVRPGPGSCKLESCESSTLYATIWSPDCFGACCGDPQGGAGGGGGVGGMGEN